MDQSPGGEDAALQVVFYAMEGLAKVLINVAACGLYSLAGLVLPPAVFAGMAGRSGRGVSLHLPRAWRTALGALGPLGVGHFVPHSRIRYAGCCAANQ